MNFCHLHNHDEYSLLDGLGTAKDYISRAKELGHEYVAITNHGNIDGLIKFQNEAKGSGVCPIFGVELYIVEDFSVKEKGEKRKHITVLINSKQGWININKILTVANIEGFYSRPRVSPKLLLDNCEGLTILTACSSSFITEEWGRRFFVGLKRKISDNLFLEIMPHDYPDQIKLNKLSMEFSKEFSIPIVATNDCHYVRKGDEKAHEVLLAIQSKKKWKDPTRWKFSVDGLYLKSRDEMISSFKNQKCVPQEKVEEALDNTVVVAKQCKDFFIEKTPVSLPEVYCGEENKNKTDEEIIRYLCEKGFREKVCSKRAVRRKEIQYRERLEEELDVIIKQGFARYFLIVWELVRWCNNNDIMVGPGRGSAGGSLICYLLNITAVDPIKHDLLFARFISPARIDLPDIDLDFEDIKRNKIFEHFKDIYGENNVAAVSTFSTMKGKGAVRDVSRVFDVPIIDVNAASSCIVVRSGGDFRCLEENTEVYTTEGTKKISELKIGDRLSRVFSERIESGEVCGLWDNGDTEVFELELESGKKIICSDKHRFWTKKGWKKLSELKEDDEILTADKEEIYHNCLSCGAIIWGKKKQFCSLSCTATYRNTHNNPMKNLETATKMKNTKKGKRCKWHDDPVKMAIFAEKQRERATYFNPMKNSETVKKQSAALRKVMGEINSSPEKADKNRQYMLDRLDKNPESHPLRLLAKNPRKGVSAISYYQNILSAEIKKIVGEKYSVEDEFPICRKINGIKKKNGHYYLDVAIPELMLNFEYDGMLHKNQIQEDAERDKFLSELGWKTIRFKKRDLDDLSYLEKIKECLI